VPIAPQHCKYWGAEESFQYIIIALFYNNKLLSLSQLNSDSRIYATDTLIDELGNSFVARSFQGSVDLNPGLSTTFPVSTTGYYVAYVLQSGNNGTFEWAEIIDNYGSCQARKISMDQTGALYVARDCNHTVDMDPTPDTSFLTYGWTNDTTDVFIQKLSGFATFILDEADQNGLPNNIQVLRNPSTGAV
jgi:hypothetical protein